MSSPLHARGLAALAAGLAKREFSSVELTRHLLGRFETAAHVRGGMGIAAVGIEYMAIRRLLASVLHREGEQSPGTQRGVCRSVYERLRREYKTLTNLPDHPHVVKVIWADRMADAKQTPYIVFEYVEGLDVSDLIDAEALSLDDAVRIVREAADGLAHLHKHGVYCRHKPVTQHLRPLIQPINRALVNHLPFVPRRGQLHADVQTGQSLFHQ